MPVVRVILREGQKSGITKPMPRCLPRIVHGGSPGTKTVSRHFTFQSCTGSSHRLDTSL
jgi:hypothetical protein